MESISTTKKKESRDFLSWLLHQCTVHPKEGPTTDGKQTSMQEAAVLYHDFLFNLYKKHGVDKLIEFYETLSKEFWLV